MWYPCTPVTVSTMPSLPLSPAVPAIAMPTSHTSSTNKYREVVYRLDGPNRYISQSYEIRSSSRQSSPVPPPCMQHLKSANYSFVPQSVAPAKPSSSKTTSKNTVLVVQSREGLQQDQPDAKARAVEPSKSAAPPPAPRPRRLPTPELSDTDDDQPFCHCDSEKNCASALCRRALL